MKGRPKLMCLNTVANSVCSCGSGQCLTCALDCCVLCCSVHVHLPPCPILLLLHQCCTFLLVAAAGLMRIHGLRPALEAGRAQAATCHVLATLIIPLVNQPMLALRLPLWRGLLMPLGLELVGGPRSTQLLQIRPITLPLLRPLLLVSSLTVAHLF